MIRGKLLLTKKEVSDIVIISLGLGTGISAASSLYEAEKICQTNKNVLIFDFVGGSSVSQSDGKTTKMSILTEVKDLECVVNSVISDDRFDNKAITLLGFSQGGLVSALVAARHPEAIQKLILFYPAFSIPDTVKKMSHHIPAFLMPKKMNIDGNILGPIFVKDVRKLHIWKEFKKYQKPVLIIYGEKDPICTQACISKAKASYSNLQLLEIPEAGHGFSKEQTDTAMNAVFSFLL
ncbi:alpha/beta fold hydrolase [Oenococcus oeni]|uniref:alpha/beta fold hydrolase n=1 Tax=Oenococcus oeni TaxID=1247 RepID=UPI001647E2B4|nr:alpha/beta fold hydrolase [Oenococcus oeni]